VKYRKYKDNAELTEDFTFVHKAKIYIIPEGFVFDGASIPVVFRWIIGKPFDKKFIIAALIHDWLYTVHLFSRLEADELFYENLINSKVGINKAKIMFSAVRIGGSGAWINTRDDIDQIEFLMTKLVKDGKDLSQYDFGAYRELKDIILGEQEITFNLDRFTEEY
jgi:hypothetical protein